MCDGHVDPRQYRPGTDPVMTEQLSEIFLRAVVYAGHPKETVRVMAGGTIAAVEWLNGRSARPPWTGREVLMPSLADVGVEYEAVVQAKARAEDRVDLANDVGVVDVLRYLVNPYGGTPWWASIPEPLPATPNRLGGAA